MNVNRYIKNTIKLFNEFEDNALFKSKLDTAVQIKGVFIIYVEILRKKPTTLNRINIVILFQFSDIRKYILWYKNKISLNFWYQRIDFFFTSKQLKIFNSKNSNSWNMYLKINFWNQKIHLICNSFICNLKGFHTNKIHVQINTAAIHNQLVLTNKLKLN